MRFVLTFKTGADVELEIPVDVLLEAVKLDELVHAARQIHDRSLAAPVEGLDEAAERVADGVEAVAVERVDDLRRSSSVLSGWESE